jgi:hypothetical protein
MNVAKKLDKAFKKFIPADCRKDKEAYQALFAKVASIVLAESDIIPWVPANKKQPDHLEDVLAWLEPTSKSQAHEKGTWKLAWYNWKHEVWVLQDGLINPEWEVTHWLPITSPWEEQ